MDHEEGRGSWSWVAEGFAGGGGVVEVRAGQGCGAECFGAAELLCSPLL